MSTKVAIIGLGYIGKVHLDTLLRIPGLEVVAISDVNEAIISDISKKYGIPKYTTDWNSLLDDPEIEAFHNCTPNNLHFELNKILLQEGKHILSEKPLCLSKDQARELRDLAVENNCITGINHCYRYYPSVQEIAQRIKKGEIGDVHTIFGSYFQDWLLYDTDYNWRLDPVFTGLSNTMADIGSHWMDLAQFVSNLKVVEVMADLNTIHPIRKKARKEYLTYAKPEGNDFDDVAVEVDDYGSVLLHFENGAHGCFSVCQVAAGRKCTIDLQVYGTKTAYAWNHERPAQFWIGNRDEANSVLFENALLFHQEAGKFAHLPAGHPLGYYDAVYNLFSEFYRAIDAQNAGKDYETTLPDFNQGLNMMTIIEAIIKSHQEKCWVKINS
jgi:predicted dehydrogenase